MNNNEIKNNNFMSNFDKKFIKIQYKQKTNRQAPANCNTNFFLDNLKKIVTVTGTKDKKNHYTITIFKHEYNITVLNGTVSNISLNDNSYLLFFTDKEEDVKNFSQIIRDSLSFYSNDDNTIHTNRYKLIFDSKGSCIIFNNYFFTKQNSNKDNETSKCIGSVNVVYEDILLLFLLGLTYNNENEHNMQKVTEICNNNSKNYKLDSLSYNELLKLKYKMLNFDLNYYFDNPVKNNRQEYYKVWNFIASQMHIPELHNESKNQCLDIIHFLNDYREKKINTRFTLIGIFISLLALVATHQELYTLYKKIPIKEISKFINDAWQLFKNYI